MKKEIERVRRKERENKAVLFVLLIGILLTIDVFSASAFGQCLEHSYHWVVGSGNWFTPDNWRHEEWDPDLEECVPIPGVPGSGDSVHIENSGTATISIGANVELASVKYNSNLSLFSGSLAITDGLQVDWGGLFEQSGGQTSARYENVGSRGTGILTQTGGTNTIHESLNIGLNTGSKGIYELSGDGELSAPCEWVARHGTATFRQTGGTNIIQDVLGIGFEPGSNGTYIQTGGTNILTGQRGELTLAHKGGSQGRYELSGDSELQAETEIVGYEGEGTFIQTGGRNTVGDRLPGLGVGHNAGSVGRYELTNATLVAGYIFVGWEGNGTFVQSGGNVTIDEGLLIGRNPGGEGIYELHGGTVDVGEFISIGEEGTGSFIMDGGTINATTADADVGVCGSTGSLTGEGTFNIEVCYESEDIYGDGDDSVDITFKPGFLTKAGTYNVNQLTPADFAGGAAEDLLTSSVFDVSFDGEWDGKFTIAIPYKETDIADRLDEDNMKLHILHQKTGQNWYTQLEDVNTDPIENIVYGKADSFGKFALSGDPFLVFDVTQPPVQHICQVAPASLTLYSINGCVIHTWGCFSGAYAVYNQEVMINNSRFARWKYLGPIPPGVWYVGCAGSRRGEKHPTWYPLYPKAGTNTFDRDEDTFYIHGGAKIPECSNIVGHSQGCIVIMPGQFESTFVPQFESVPNVLDAMERKDLLLYVEYNFPDAMDVHPLPDPLMFVRYELHSPANLFLQKENEHVCGYDPDLGEVINDIDGATYSGPGTEPRILTYPLFSTSPVVDQLTLVPVGPGGPYQLEVTYQKLDGSVVTAQQTGQVLQGKPVEYSVAITPDAISLSPDEVPTLSVIIDIYPNRAPNRVYLSRNYTIYVAVLGSASFDVTTLDSSTVLFGPSGTEASPVRAPTLRDLNTDGFIDAMYGFRTFDCGFQFADTEGWITGSTTGGTLVEGSDSVVVLP